MDRCIIWYDGAKTGGRYSLLDALTREPVLGENGQQLTDLSFKQAMDMFEKQTGQQKVSDGLPLRRRTG
jgi:hypothetical protein